MGTAKSKTVKKKVVKVAKKVNKIKAEKEVVYRIAPYMFVRNQKDCAINLARVDTINLWSDLSDATPIYGIRFHFDYMHFKDMKFLSKEERNKYIKDNLGLEAQHLSVETPVEKAVHANAKGKTYKTVSKKKRSLSGHDPTYFVEEEQ